MSTYRELLDTAFNYRGIDLYATLKDNIFNGYTAKSQEGYVFYDPTEEHYEQESPDSEPIKVIHYHTIRIFPPNYDIDKFSLIGVPRDTVDSKYIF